jgi:hypothetical protein
MTTRPLGSWASLTSWALRPVTTAVPVESMAPMAQGAAPVSTEFRLLRWWVRLCLAMSSKREEDSALTQLTRARVRLEFSWLSSLYSGLVVPVCDESASNSIVTVKRRVAAHPRPFESGLPSSTIVCESFGQFLSETSFSGAMKITL